jgi:hypothetical protein
MAANHVALLRGINVGTAKRVAMEDLRALMGGLGYGDVRTLLNSGNVVFSANGRSGDPSRRIGVEIEKKLGVKSRVTVLTAAELDVAVRGNSLLKVATHPSRLLVGVLASRDDRARLEPLARPKVARRAPRAGRAGVLPVVPRRRVEEPGVGRGGEGARRRHHLSQLGHDSEAAGLLQA